MVFGLAATEGYIELEILFVLQLLWSPWVLDNNKHKKGDQYESLIIVTGTSYVGTDVIQSVE